MLLENGVLLTFMVAKHSGDVEAVLVDKTLVAKLQARADHGILLLSLLFSPPPLLPLSLPLPSILLLPLHSFLLPLLPTILPFLPFLPLPPPSFSSQPWW